MAVQIVKQSRLQHVFNIICSCHIALYKQEISSSTVGYGSSNHNFDSPVYMPSDSNYNIKYMAMSYPMAIAYAQIESGFVLKHDILSFCLSELLLRRCRVCILTGLPSFSSDWSLILRVATKHTRKISCLKCISRSSLVYLSRPDGTLRFLYLLSSILLTITT